MGFMEGDIVELRRDAGWKNYQEDPQVLKKGSVVKLQSWCPEGFQMTIEKAASGSKVNYPNGWYFVFAEHLKASN